MTGLAQDCGPLAPNGRAARTVDRTAAQGRAMPVGEATSRRKFSREFFINPNGADWFWAVTARSPGG
jgi:hypothetical protein